MSVAPLYSVAVLIWGTTWIAATFQLGTVAPAVSVAYRFALASLLFLAYCVTRGIRLSFPLREHAWFALQGALLSISFICIYVSLGHIASGLVAIVFSLAVVLNVVGARVFFRTPLRPQVLAAAALGVIGILLIFAPLIRPSSDIRAEVLGAGAAAAGTAASSLYNMTIVRGQAKGISVIQMNCLAMLYCALFSSAYVIAIGGKFDFDWHAKYVISLLYLSVVGTAMVFLAYLELVRRIGPERAGYVGVAVPVVALIVSSLFENLRWETAGLLGLASCIAGNVLMLRKPAA